MNPLLGPQLILRALDDIARIATAVSAIPALAEEIVRVRQGVDGLREEMRPIQELPAVRGGLGELRERLDGMTERLDGMTERLDGLRGDVEPIQQLAEVRKGIEPLDEDMNSVRHSIDDIEPLVREVLGGLRGLDQRIEVLRQDLSPLGELADKVPGVRKR